MSIEEKIIARLFALLEPLKVAGRVRKIEELNDAAELKGQRNALYLSFGAEQNLADEENLRGYVLEFPVAIILLVEGREPQAVARGIKADIQRALEADLQLNDETGRALATKIIYQGSDLFFSAGSKLLCGCEINYLVQYHRTRANPDINY